MAQLRLAEASEREAVGSRAFQRAVGTHVLLEYSVHQLRAHLKVIEDFSSVAGADNTINNAILLAATSSDAVATAAAAASAVATQEPALLSPPLSPSGSEVGTWTRTTPEPTSEGATAAPAQHLTAIASQEEVKEEPSGAKESLLLDHRSVRKVNEKIFKCEQKKVGRLGVSEVPIKRGSSSKYRRSSPRTFGSLPFYTYHT